MVAKAMHEHAARVDAGIDVQVLTSELVARHDPYEAALLAEAEAAVMEGRQEDAIGLITRLRLIDERENRVHKHALAAARVMTGDLSGADAVMRKGAA